MEEYLPRGIKTAYVEGFEFIYSDKNPYFFEVIPEKLYDVSYDKSGSRYIIHIGHMHHSIIQQYVQWNPNSGTVRIILAIVDENAHVRTILHDLGNEDLATVINHVKKTKPYNIAIKLIQKKKLNELYSFQQKMLKIDQKIAELITN